jgi:hypothetical protein
VVAGSAALRKAINGIALGTECRDRAIAGVAAHFRRDGGFQGGGAAASRRWRGMRRRRRRRRRTRHITHINKAASSTHTSARYRQPVVPALPLNQ